MPLIIAIPYFIIEALAFWAVAEWIGVGWALLALFAFFFGGLVLAAWEMRRISVQASQGRVGAGQMAGNFGLIAAGAIGCALPGFVTSLLGLLLIISPTRAIVRRLMARKIRMKVEDLGVRGFERVNKTRQESSYGSFADPNSVVIEEEEIQSWSSKVEPEDFFKDNPDKDGK